MYSERYFLQFSYLLYKQETLLLGLRNLLLHRDSKSLLGSRNLLQTATLVFPRPIVCSRVSNNINMLAKKIARPPTGGHGPPGPGLDPPLVWWNNKAVPWRGWFHDQATLIFCRPCWDLCRRLRCLRHLRRCEACSSEIPSSSQERWDVYCRQARLPVIPTDVILGLWVRHFPAESFLKFALIFREIFGNLSITYANWLFSNPALQSDDSWQTTLKIFML